MPAIRSGRVRAALLLGIFLLMLLGNVLTPYAVDDWAYMHSFATGERLTRFGEIFPSMAAHAQTMNGRLFAHFWAQLFLLLPKAVFNIVNALIFTALIALLARLTQPESERDNLILLMIFCAVWVFVPAFGQVFFWLDGACNYGWGCVIGFAFLAPYIRLLDRDAKKKPLFWILWMLAGFYTGAYLENMAAGAIFLSALLLFGRRVLCRKKNGVLPWLPVLAGEIIGSSQMSERFLWDWRRTLGELFCENYDRINEIVNEYDLAGRYTESHEASRAYTGDGMDPKIKATIPMAAFWMENTPTGSAVPSAICDIRESASVSHIYGQRLVAAESFSVNGDEGRAYTYCPENMKYIADVGLSAGVNRFVIHESASQPNDQYLPGLQLFRYGQWLHRNETWGEYAWVLTDYLARSSSMLQQGNSVADILLYYGEDLNITGLYGGQAFSSLPQVPDGYNYDFANPTVLRSGIKVENRTLVAPSGARYRVLWLDRNCEVMSLDILKKIKEFADAGVIICGKEPKSCAGLKADDRAFASIVDDIWHSRRKNVFAKGLEDCLRRSGIQPDFRATVTSPVAEPVVRHSSPTIKATGGYAGHFDKLSDRNMSLSDQENAVEAPANAPDSYGDFKYVHRTIPDSTQIYWVRNFSGKDSNVELSFRDGGKFAAIFNPENGDVTDADVKFGNGRSTVSLPLLSADARFVVLSNRPQIKVTIDTVFVNTTDTTMICTSDSTEVHPVDSLVSAGHFDTTASSAQRKLSDQGISLRDQQNSVAEPVEATTIQTVTSTWQVHFDQKNGGTADEEFPELVSWTRKENPIVKYFSGTAIYKTTVTIDSTQLATSARIFIDLGVVKNIADLSINGTPAGVLWKAPFRTADIKPLLKEGDNLLEIKITNVWRNRMIGDVQPGEKHPVTAIRRFYKSTDKLLPSGLLGPVRIITEQ